MIKNILNFIREYLTTIIVTVVVVILICLCVELNLLYNTEKLVIKRELNNENLLDFCKIEQLEKRFNNEPKNHFVALRLAKHYEKLQIYKQANSLYAIALKYSNDSPYVAYSYAMFLARRGLFANAIDLAEKLSLHNKKCIEYRADIYEELAKTFEKKENYEGAVKSYQLAQKYAKNSKEKLVLDRINSNYARCYILLADHHVHTKDIDSAILDLKNSLKIKESALAKYKLALIYQNIDKVQAEKYFGDVMVSDIYLLNPYIYSKLLNDLILESKTSFDTHKFDFYTLRLNKLNKFMEEYFVFKNDVLISEFHIVEDKKLLSKKREYTMHFDLTNNTRNKLRRLHIKAEIFANNKQYVVNREVVSPIKPVMYYDTIKDVKIPLPPDFKLSDIKKQNDIIVKYYARKNLRAPWTLIKIESVHF